MRALFKGLIALMAVVAVFGLLGASVRPFLADDVESSDEDEEVPSFYAKAQAVERVQRPVTAIQIQLALLQHHRT